MENKSSSKRNAALDSFVIFSKKPRGENENNNVSFISNQSCSSFSSTSPSSSIAANID
jgi:hypothetical protein